MFDPSKKRARVTKEDADRWQTDRDAGDSVITIAAREGRGRRTIYDHTHAPFNQAPRAQDLSPDDTTIEAWQHRRECGDSIDDIAASEGWGHSTVAKYTCTPMHRRKVKRAWRLKPLTHQAWKELHAYGYSVRAIARHYGVTMSTVYLHTSDED